MCHDAVCQLLELPAELRNTIYSFILIQQLYDFDHRLVPRARNGLEGMPYTHRICTSILLTCKQINREATPILYGQNMFAAHPSLLTSFPSMITRLHPRMYQSPPVLERNPISFIRRFRIDIRLDVDPRFDKVALQESFSGVEDLQVMVYQAMYGGSDFSVLSLFEGIRDVGTAKVVGSVGDGVYARWLESVMMAPPDKAIEPYEHHPKAWNSWTDGNR